jgi:hypothetical protein
MATPGSEAAYSEVLEDAPDSRQAQTIHHIRANSSIMQLKKILGEWAGLTKLHWSGLWFSTILTRHSASHSG